VTSENQIMRDWTSRLNIGRTTDDSKIASSFSGSFKTEQDQVVWINEFKTPRGSTTAGAEWREERVSSTTNYDQKKRQTGSLFAGYLERFGESGEQQLDFSLRRDEESQFGRRNTGSIAYGIQLWPALLLYARAGRAFRAPSFNDLYFPGFSTPTLKPERSEQAEIGARWNSAWLRTSLVRFDHRIEDLIAPDFVTFVPVNVSRARIKGWESSGDTVLAGFGIKTSLTSQRPIDAETGRQLRSRAKIFGSLAVDRTIGQWTIGSDVVTSGRRFDSAIESAGSRMGGYAVLNARIAYQVNKLVTVELNAQNIADRQYELARGYNPPGRSLFLNVKLVGF
jgi:vitamin B12 transporter